MAKIHRHNTWSLFSPIHIGIWLLFGLVSLIGKLPHKYAIKIGSSVGHLLYYFFPKRKYIIKTNLKTCFPDKCDNELNLLVKKNLQSLIIGVCETAIAWYGSDKEIEKLGNKIEIINENLLNEAYDSASSDKPLIILTPHTMSQELLSRYLVKKYEYAPVFRHMNNPVANYLMQKARQGIYKHLILKADTRSIVKTIRKNETKVGILPDQDFGRKRSVFVPFFAEQETATTTSLSKYKKLTNADMIVASYHRVFNQQNGEFEKFVITIYPKLNITGDNLEHDAREFNKVLEEIIKKDITTYFWLAKKFKTRPLNKPKIYNYISQNPLKKIKNYFKPIEPSSNTRPS